jgi:hypothetical protein
MLLDLVKDGSQGMIDLPTFRFSENQASLP